MYEFCFADKHRQNMKIMCFDRNQRRRSLEVSHSVTPITNLVFYLFTILFYRCIHILDFIRKIIPSFLFFDIVLFARRPTAKRAQEEFYQRLFT
jgi:hypothetical protein